MMCDNQNGRFGLMLQGCSWLVHQVRNFCGSGLHNTSHVHFYPLHLLLGLQSKVRQGQTTVAWCTYLLTACLLSYVQTVFPITPVHVQYTQVWAKVPVYK